ncbi:uncharacterized protein N7515_008908 [Penicillium bovifimosum]|uniref:Uncharacterized protein n=1 Tax=Penicillium bovifimosum TaxID=126998 RepID=A0A9W9GP45_9EURO|nr:uncharacterized protein N7515_008908 [Penicillium bovifimosum]KAJ5125083.1 hypothetical protein N7515_008908 [Penicillium bovifimosum]
MLIPLSILQHPNGYLRELNVTYDPDLPISHAFGRVSVQRGWKPGSKRWRKAWNACMNSEYNRLIGSRVTSLATWQELCAKVGLRGSFESINKCKKALARVHVNIVDLLECWNSDSTPTIFKSQKALAVYTQGSQKYFKRDVAKQDNVLKVLLRKLI